MASIPDFQRKLKQPKMENRGEEDRISNLPFDIRLRILSLLPTFDAVCTNVLSKNWVNLWTSLPNLDFNFDSLHHNEEKIQKIARLESFVSYVFSKRVSLQLQIQSLRICLDYPCVWLENWIQLAAKCQVRDIDVEINDKFSINTLTLPQCIANSDRLVNLKLGGPVEYVIPGNVWLPSLKVLHIRTIRVRNQSMEKLLSGCPVLENLLVECEDVRLDFSRLGLILPVEGEDNLMYFNIIVPSLKKLRISLLVKKNTFPYEADRMHEIIEVVAQGLRYAAPKHWIDTPNLESFTLELDGMINVKELIGLLKQVSSVRYLTMRVKEIRFGGAHNLEDVCHNIFHLELLETDFNLALRLLKFFPSLELLKLGSRRQYEGKDLMDLRLLN